MLSQSISDSARYNDQKMFSLTYLGRTVISSYDKNLKNRDLKWQCSNFGATGVKLLFKTCTCEAQHVTFDIVVTFSFINRKRYILDRSNYIFFC